MKEDLPKCKCGCKTFDVQDYIFTYQPKFNFSFSLICLQCSGIYAGKTEIKFIADSIRFSKINGKTIKFVGKEDYTLSKNKPKKHEYLFFDECSNFTNEDWKHLDKIFKERKLNAKSNSD